MEMLIDVPAVMPPSHDPSCLFCSNHIVTYNRLMEPFLPVADCTAGSTVEFFLDPAGDTGEMSGMTNGV